ncbi:helix-turn-helix domain protein [Nitrosococcus halophilus Nc 4]|uniref:Helix-turn-helix domain protein n=1 Tax=Nitrosococcus halophilus (strain Nc4) TaxID=472759 RepID=D5BXH1_NITHN|nr:helix-turn-helix domain-containing protein [Nitrosococcus halophilus]ADE13929.1 helix-turn-helix domain protein [Nitrosococcus halophilus Nc 4]
MTELSAAFAPDWVSPPGESILDISEERGWTQAELAQRLGYTEKHVSRLINGKVPLSVDAALRLERVVGGTVDFWLSREANYQNHKARLEAAEKHANWVSWLDDLPVKELMDNGTITKQRLVGKNKPSVVESCLRFFGVASPDEWRAHYGGMQMAFRRSRAEQCDVGAISSWLRLGEQQAEQVDVPKYNKARFEKALRVIRTFTCDPPEDFEPKMRQLLSEAGVTFVLVPAISRAHVSGVARWLGPTRPLIQLSLYGKTNDKFWFTFFHEAAHILLHSGGKEEKKSVFLDDPNATHTDDPQEHEANSWAGDWLIPSQYSGRLTSLTSKADVRHFAKEIGIHPGIVVGRLQHDGVIPPSWMNDLKQSFKFKKASTD